MKTGDAVPYGRHADVWHTAHVLQLHRLEGAHGLDAGQVLERGDLLRVDEDLDAVVGELVVAEHLAAERGNRALQRVLLALQARLESVLLLLAELVSRVGLRDGHRVTGQLDHQGLLGTADAERRHLRLDELVRASDLRVPSSRAARYENERRHR